MIATMEELRELMRDDLAVVLAPGPSFWSARHELICIGKPFVIGCNRVAQRFVCDFLVCIEPRGDRIWEQIGGDIGNGFTTLVTLPELHRHGSDLILPTIHPRDWPWNVDLHAGESPSSAWVAAALAAFMGASRVGVLGVDLVGHPIHGRPEEIERQNAKWAELDAAVDCEFVNLSPGGALDVLPRETLEAMTA